MAVDQEARDLINSLLAEFATRWDGGTWGVPRDFSMLVRQEQPPASGASQFKGEDLEINAGDIVLRDSGDIVATKISELTEKVTPVATDWLLLQQTDGTFRRVSATTLMSLTSQQVRDAMKLAPTGGGPSAGSIDEHLDNIPITAMRGTDSAATAANLATVDGKLDDIQGATFDTATDSLEAIRDNQGGGSPSAETIADAVWDEAGAGHVLAGSFGKEVQDHALSSEISALNDLSTAQVNTECDLALTDIHLDHLLAANYDPASKPGVATALLNELIEDDLGVSRFTTNALENAPTNPGDSAATIADAVWDELTADHVGLGTYGALEKIIDRAIRKIFNLNQNLLVP